MQNLIGKQIDDYQVIEQIGEGGMAVIYRAVQRSLGREVALKVLSSRLTYNSEFIERFRREALAAARLNHPSIVTIYNVGEQDGIHYIAMKFLKGESLDKIIRRERLSVAQVVPIIQQVAEALDHAHGQGIVHRDIKPANLIINPDGWPTLTDFGIAKALSDNKPGLTQKGMIIGTPHYMAPEQIQGLKVDNRADIYALGILCYEMLAGMLPFQGDTASVMYAQLNAPPPPLRQMVPDVPVHVEAAINRALAKNKEQRFQRASDFAAALASPSAYATQAAPPPTYPPTQVAPGSYPPTQQVNPPPYPSEEPYPAPPPPPPPSTTQSTSSGLPKALIVLVIVLALALTGTLSFLFAWYLNQTDDGQTTGPTVEVVSTETPTEAPVFLDATPTPTLTTIPASATATNLPATVTNPPASATPSATTPVSPTASPTNNPSPTPEVGLELTQTALLNRLTVRSNTQPVFSYATDSPPIIDGEFSEWANEPFTEVSAVVFNPQNTTGASDLSLSFATQWNSSHLYLAVRVRDDTLVQTERGEAIFRGDSLELIIDSELEADFSNGRLGADDYQIGVLPGEVFNRSDEVYRWFPAERKGALSSVRVSSQPTSDGYQVELQLPWDEIGITPQAQTAYGFNLGANDNDTPNTANQQSLLSLSPVRKLTDPTTWGTLVLME